MNGVEVKGLEDFVRELRQFPRRFERETEKAGRKVGERVVDQGASRVRELASPAGSLAARGLLWKPTDSGLTLELDSGKGPTLFASIFGTLSHMVFGRRVSGSGPWEQWIGSSWEPEDLYGLGEVIEDTADDFALETYLDAAMEALGPAFPS